MSPLKARHANCSVVGCTNRHKCLYSVPAKAEQKRQWLRFIFNDNVPAALPASSYVCANHFTPACFSNEGQYKAGFASTLSLVKGSLPTIRDPATAPGPSASTSCASIQPPASRDAASQTDPVSTQLSLRTPQSHLTSKGVQATVSCQDVGVGTSLANPFWFSSTLVTSPSKRPRLDLKEELEEDPLERPGLDLKEELEEDPLERPGLDLKEELEEDPVEGSSAMAAPKVEDPTYDPAESVTALPESQESSAPTHKIRKYVVQEGCVMELFGAW